MGQPLGDWRSSNAVASPLRSGDAVALAVGFLAVTVAVLVARGSPATGFEVSLYTATPTATWVGLAVAFVCATVVAGTTPGRRTRLAALVLAGETFVAVVALPVIRGYAFYGSGDALSHMGWIREVLGGEIVLSDLIYPGLHTTAIAVARLGGLELSHAMMLSVVVYAAAFAVFVPLAARALTDDAFAATVGVFAAAFLLPVNNVSAHLVFFPSTMAVFLFPFVMLLAIIALRRGKAARLTPVDGLLALAGVGILLVHPQQAVNVVLVFATVSVLVGIRRYRAPDPTLDPLYRHTAFLGVATAVWGLSHERISDTAGAYAGAVVGAVVGGGSAGGGAIAQRTGSLSAIGVSPLEIGVKLFFPGAVFAVLTGLLLAGALLGWFRGDRDRLPLVVLGLGLVPVGVVMVLYVLGNLQTIYFRHLGFLMALVTVFGAVAVARLAALVSGDGLDRRGVALAFVVLTPLLALSIATVFPSPFIYQPNSHVTAMEYSGYETTFAHDNESVPYAGIRAGPDRFRDAIEGTGDLESRTVRRGARVPYGELDSDLTSVFEGPRYLAVDSGDYDREIVAYGGLRYSEEGFETLGSGDGVSRVLSNGGYRVYYVAE